MDAVPIDAVSASSNSSVFALRAAGLRCVLGGRAVVDGVEITLEPGQVKGLLGPNGAGKTTVFRLLTGLVDGEGTVEIAGQDVSALATHRRARLGLGYLPQEASVFSKMTALANVLAVLEVQGRSPSYAEELLGRFGLSPLKHQLAGTLSGGERRRLELARVMAGQPKVVLLDEPFAALDPIAVTELRQCIAELAAEQVAVLLSDHRVETALTICHDACILKAGCIVCEGPAAQLTSDARAQRTFFGQAATEIAERV